MKKQEPTRTNADDLRGLSRLTIDATKGITDIVAAMHRTIASGPAVLGEPLRGPASLITGMVYGGIQTITDLVGSGIEHALVQLAPLLGDNVPGPQREAVLSALNGVLGDFLHDSNNPLAIQMSLRQRGRPVVPTNHSRLVVVVHGSCMNDLQWQHGEHNHGEVVATALDAAAVYVHYNTGLHVSENGSALASLLDERVRTWPAPVTDIVVVAHSMGGLVTRSACLHAQQRGLAWRSHLRSIAFLGTPHHGAPLERGGSWIDMLLGSSRYSAPLARLGQIRSAGVTDLRYGTVRETDTHDDRFAFADDHRQPLPLPNGVRCWAVAASTAAETATRKPGDGLVPIDSALGRHPNREHVLHFDSELLIHEANHLDLLSRTDVSTSLCDWMQRTG
jgi:pimeloyl-ACP methyl ester carboxylesterase